MFKGKRPKGFKAVGISIRKVYKRVKQDKDLAAEVKRLKLSQLEE